MFNTGDMSEIQANGASGVAFGSWPELHHPKLHTIVLI